MGSTHSYWEKLPECKTYKQKYIALSNLIIDRYETLKDYKWGTAGHELWNLKRFIQVLNKVEK